MKIITILVCDFLDGLRLAGSELAVITVNWLNAASLRSVEIVNVYLRST